MLQIAIACCCVTATRCQCRLLMRFSSVVGVGSRILLAAAVAFLTYIFAVSAFTSACPKDWPGSPAIYAAGLATATLMSICVLTLAAPRPLGARILPIAAASAVLLQVAWINNILASHAPQLAHLGYLLAVYAGGIGGTKLSLWALTSQQI